MSSIQTHTWLTLSFNKQFRCLCWGISHSTSSKSDKGFATGKWHTHYSLCITYNINRGLHTTAKLPETGEKYKIICAEHIFKQGGNGVIIQLTGKLFCVCDVCGVCVLCECGVCVVFVSVWECEMCCVCVCGHAHTTFLWHTQYASIFFKVVAAYDKINGARDVGLGASTSM
jgi:hypothetical protein